MTTTAKTEIMNDERFAQGMTWAQYFDSIQANKEKFKYFHDEFTPKPEEVAWFKQYHADKGPLKMVVIGEDWCPDVVRGIPVAVRLAEEAGIDLRIFPRDSHMDLMNEYLWRHEFLSIPIIVFFGKDWKELGHWTERPATGYKFIAELREELANQSANEEDTLKTIRERREGIQMVWAHETVRELREQVLYRVM